MARCVARYPDESDHPEVPGAAIAHRHRSSVWEGNVKEKNRWGGRWCLLFFWGGGGKDFLVFFWVIIFFVGKGILVMFDFGPFLFGLFGGIFGLFFLGGKGVCFLFFLGHFFCLGKGSRWCLFSWFLILGLSCLGFLGNIWIIFFWGSDLWP